MNEEDVSIRLAEVIATMEERTDNELISVIKDTLMGVGTGMRADSVNDQYKIVYKELDSRLSNQGMSHPNQFDDLWSFIDYWKENGLETYSSRRNFVRGIYRDNGSSNHDGFWASINPTIREVAKSRFDSKHYADAVEASFKEINSRIKEEVRQRTGDTLDGAALMNTAFSLKKPIIILEDQGTEDGRSIQNGYMQMFAGAMTAVRNPKAHSNVEIEPEEAIPLIQLASLLFTKFETAINRDKAASSSSASEPTKKKGIYLRVVNPDDHETLLKIKKIAGANSGASPIILVLGDKGRSAIRLPFGMDDSEPSIGQLHELLGVDNVVVRK